MDQLYPMKQVAKQFNVTVVTIKNWIEKYNLPHQKTENGYIFFTQSNIEAIKRMLIKRYNLG